MRETVLRIVSGLAIGGLVICALRFDFGVWLLPLIMVLLFSQLGLIEFCRITNKGVEGRAFRVWAQLIAVLIVLGFYGEFLGQMQKQGAVLPALHSGLAKVAPSGTHVAVFLLLLLMILTFATQIVLRPLDGGIYSLAVTLLGVVYTTFTISHVFLLFSMSLGVFYIVFFAVIPIASDTGAYFAGRLFGKHNAGLKVSPKKTYEGYFGGFALTVALANGLVWGWKKWSGGPDIPVGYLEASILGVVFGVLSVVGDLAESAIKRDAKLKDSASTIPGHGGMLDLADAIYLALPMGYYYLWFKATLGFAV